METSLSIRPGYNAELEKSLTTKTDVLDHGFVRLVDYMGSDNCIASAARVSYGEGTKSVNSDEALIRYLIRHKHTSPIEQAEIKLHVKMPIFVARQWIRHRTANVNEVSGRYSIVKNEFYIPNPEMIAVQSSSNKQGRGEVLSSGAALQVRQLIAGSSQSSFDMYDFLLADENVARELARIVVPLNTYTEFYWKIDAHNLLHFLQLRMDPHAQIEIRAYANAIADIVKVWLPATWRAFCDYKRDAYTCSFAERYLLSTILCAVAKQTSMTVDELIADTARQIKDVNIPKLTARELAELTVAFSMEKVGETNVA